jgi:sterol desaturase/sphingolipid hydroxylase (fatty acid hydroxylase superfamily)
VPYEKARAKNGYLRVVPYAAGCSPFGHRNHCEQEWQLWVYGSTTLVLVVILMVTDAAYSLSREWRMIGFQGLVSHFNVDIRAGWLNYIFIGTETHRYHHSAAKEEAENYGVVLALWDIVFGTFYYRPGVTPEKLGVEHPEDYPSSENLVSVFRLPFRK